MELVSNAVLVQGVTLQDLERMVKRVVSQQLEEYKSKLPPPQKAVVTTKKTPTYIKRKDAAKLLSVSLTTLDKWTMAGFIHPCRICSRVYFTQEEIDRALGNTAPY